jgi:AcrR family transcriptional regulator
VVPEGRRASSAPKRSAAKASAERAGSAGGDQPDGDRERRKRPKDRRARFVRAAAHLFRERGYPAVSIYDIGEAVGVSSAALYRHFANKEALLVAAYEESLEKVCSLEPQVDDGADTKELLQASMRAELAFAISDLDMAAIYLREARHIEKKPPQLLAAHRGYIKRWIELIRELRPELSPEEARFIVMSLSGITSSLLYYRLPLPAGRLVDVLSRAGVAAVLTPPEHVAETAPPPEPEPGDDSARRERILAVALRMFRQYGFHGVSIDTIGDAAGITGPSVYRHFESKEKLLEAGFDLGYQQIMASAHRALDVANSREEALHLLIDSYVERAIENADLVAVYMTESRALPSDRERAVRRNQRNYVNEWIAVLEKVRPDLSEAEARVLVQAAIGMLNLGGQNTRHLPDAFVRSTLTAMATGALAS